MKIVHLFNSVFKGSRYLSWLPSFSVEVTHSLRPTSQIHTSQIETMARQVKFVYRFKYINNIIYFLYILGSTIISTLYYAFNY